MDALSGGGLIRDNLDLSAIRATNTFRALIDHQPDIAGRCSKKGAECAAVLSVSGYGSERPVVAGDDDAAKRRNRRIDLRLIMVAPDSTAAIQAVSQELAAR